MHERVTASGSRRRRVSARGWSASLATVSLAMGLTLASLVVPARGQEPAPEDLYIDQVDVNVVNIEVFVTDSQGRRITGLEREDFELYEDGLPVAITNFYAVEGGQPRPGAGWSARPQEEPPIGTRLATLPVIPAEQQLHLIVYIDNMFIRPFNRNKVLTSVRQFLHAELTQGDRVMLATYDRSLHVRHGFTSDRRAIADELFNLEKLTGNAVQAASERRDFMHRIDQSRSQSEAEGHAHFYAASLYNDMSRSVKAMKDLVGSLAGLPGRKAILYVSDGIPMTLGQDIFFLLDERFTGRISGQLRAGRYSARRLFRELTASANANRVTFYTLEAAGLRSHESLSAEYASRANTEGTPLGSRIQTDTLRMADYQEPLLAMAEDTGGQATISTNNFSGGLERMAEDFRNYYSLGYSPAHTSDGRYHKLEVKVKRKKAQVRHRSGYRDKTAQARVTEGTLAALLYGLEKNPLGVEIQLEPARPREEGHFLVPVLVRVPIGNLTLLPQQGSHEGRLRVSVAVIDTDGGMSPVELNEVPISIPDADIEVARKQYYVYAAELLMRGGNQKIAVGVRDDLAGEISFVRQPVAIGS